ncbi:hypothetical protein R1flu_013552 [Riccia fluitans]|uniref:Uncharacterized protein n=1 Tax=Riccia fluitans TaxID=41844 RepID=A0ABD1YDW6_9MARC
MFGVPMFGERGGGHHHQNQPSPGFMGNFRSSMALDETLNTIKKTWDAASRVLAESCKLPSLAFKYQFTPGLLNTLEAPVNCSNDVTPHLKPNHICLN